MYAEKTKLGYRYVHHLFTENYVKHNNILLTSG